MSKRLVQLLFIVAFLLGQAYSIYALDPHKAPTQYVHDIWQAQQGLPQGSGMTIIQTRDGYIWIGTQEGLTRFDGVQFTIFDKQNTPALKNNFVQKVLQSWDGSLWIGTGGGGLTHLAGSESKNYRREDGLLSDVVWDLCEDSQGYLWIGTAGGGLLRFRAGRFTAYGEQEGVRGSRVLAILQDGKGRLWVGTDGGGLVLYSNGKFRPYPATLELNSETVGAIIEDRRGNLWIGTAHGLKCLRDGKITSYTTQDGLTGNQVNALLEDREGSLWIGMQDGGLNRFSNRTFARFTSAEGLSDTIVLSLCEDREGSLWIGTFGGGINRLKDGSFTTFSSQEGLPVDLVWSVFQDRDQALWIGTNGGGLCRFQDGKFTTYTTRDGLANDSVRALTQDHKGNLWVGTFGGGVNCFRDGKFMVYTDKDGLSHNLIRALYEDRLGNLWIGTYGGGLNKLRDGKFSVYTMKDGLGNDTVYCIQEDRSGALWVGTRGGGVSRLQQGKFTTYTSKDGLSDDVVLSFYEDAQGILWISTTGGITRLKKDRFAAITSRAGLYDDQIFRILEDDRGHLWMSCNKGVFYVAKQELNDFADGNRNSVSSTSFGTTDGMKARECAGGVQPAGWKTSDGRLWFPTIGGVTMVDPTRQIKNNLRPPVYIEQVLHQGSVIEHKDSTRLPPGKGEFEFHYTALSFQAPDKVLFKYMLVGLDKEWIMVGTRRIAYYTNIPPGSYTFRVIACNNDGVWNEQGASFSFYLQPFFYQTKWFYAICALAVICAGMGIYRFRIRQLRRREKQLTLLVEERTGELNKALHQVEKTNLELADANAELERLSLTDPLTKLPNRRNFELIFSQEWKRCSRESQPLTLLMIDIDFFKTYNDTYGHPLGDECLKQVAASIQRCTSRAGDFVARLGGEEFVVVLPNTHAQGARLIAERVRAGIENLKIPHSSSAINPFVTISIGLATNIPHKDLERNKLISFADQALYQAKNKGRNRVLEA